jgi:DNA-binding protein HU-beta
MNKEQLLAQIAEKTTITKKQANQILDALTSSIMETVAQGDLISLIGFGSFEARDRKEREGRNPSTQEPITLPATRVPAFSAGKIFKEKVVESMQESKKSQKPEAKKKK